jgi:hypothetical protein
MRGASRWAYVLPMNTSVGATQLVRSLLAGAATALVGFVSGAVVGAATAPQDGWQGVAAFADGVYGAGIGFAAGSAAGLVWLLWHRRGSDSVPPQKGPPATPLA